MVIDDQEHGQTCDLFAWGAHDRGELEKMLSRPEKARKAPEKTDQQPCSRAFAPQTFREKTEKPGKRDMGEDREENLPDR